MSSLNEQEQPRDPSPKATMKIEFPTEPIDDAIGQSISRYKVLEKIGEGGCGAVYIAEQTEPVRRRVALKVIKLGMDTKSVIARFEAERQALAMMDHPNIAKVLDAGATESGRPFFVMELVKGIPITEFCDQEKISTRDRIELFIQVCGAIQHAHQKGIIHRDIKPSNILVGLHDGAPVPKVIDFGIAKATEGRLTDSTVYTQLHQFIGTPAYMSPEQAEMSGLDIDTRSDIYSLGVLLYELLVGATPFEAKALVESGIDAMRKIIREKEPVRPSTRLALLAREELTTTAKRRASDAPKLIHLLKGDLDWIAMKCLEKDRSRRYESASGLAADLKRFLNNEPVTARPPSTIYRFQKMIRRNRLAVSATVTIVILLLAGIGVSTWLAIRATRAERQARERFANARKFVREVLRDVVPELNDLIGGTKANERLARVSLAFLNTLTPGQLDDPAFRGELASLHLAMADALGAPSSQANTLGDYTNALSSSSQALTILTKLHQEFPENAEWHEMLAQAEGRVGFAQLMLRDLDGGTAHVEKGVELIKELYRRKPGSEQVEHRLVELSQTLNQAYRAKKRYVDAVKVYEEPLLQRILNLKLNENAPVTQLATCQGTHTLLGSTLFSAGNYDEALKHYREAVRLNGILLSRSPNRIQYVRAEAFSKSSLGRVLVKLGQFEEGLKNLDVGLESVERLAARDSSNGSLHTRMITSVLWHAEGYAGAADEKNLAVNERLARLRTSADSFRKCRENIALAKIKGFKLGIATFDLTEEQVIKEQRAVNEEIAKLTK